MNNKIIQIIRFATGSLEIERILAVCEVSTITEILSIDEFWISDIEQCVRNYCYLLPYEKRKEIVGALFADKPEMFRIVSGIKAKLLDVIGHINKIISYNYNDQDTERLIDGLLERWKSPLTKVSADNVNNVVKDMNLVLDFEDEIEEVVIEYSNTKDVIESVAVENQIQIEHNLIKNVPSVIESMDNLVVESDDESTIPFTYEEYQELIGIDYLERSESLNYESENYKNKEDNRPGVIDVHFDIEILKNKLTDHKSHEFNENILTQFVSICSEEYDKKDIKTTANLNPNEIEAKKVDVEANPIKENCQSNILKTESVNQTSDINVNGQVIYNNPKVQNIFEEIPVKIVNSINITPYNQIKLKYNKENKIPSLIDIDCRSERFEEDTRNQMLENINFSKKVSHNDINKLCYSNSPKVINHIQVNGGDDKENEITSLMNIQYEKEKLFEDSNNHVLKNINYCKKASDKDSKVDFCADLCSLDCVKLTVDKQESNLNNQELYKDCQLKRISRERSMGDDKVVNISIISAQKQIETNENKENDMSGLRDINCKKEISCENSNNHVLENKHDNCDEMIIDNQEVILNNKVPHKERSLSGDEVVNIPIIDHENSLENNDNTEVEIPCVLDINDKKERSHENESSYILENNNCNNKISNIDDKLSCSSKNSSFDEGQIVDENEFTNTEIKENVTLSFPETNYSSKSRDKKLCSTKNNSREKSIEDGEVTNNVYRHIEENVIAETKYISNYSNEKLSKSLRESNYKNQYSTLTEHRYYGEVQTKPRRYDYRKYSNERSAERSKERSYRSLNDRSHKYSRDRPHRYSRDRYSRRSRYVSHERSTERSLERSRSRSYEKSRNRTYERSRKESYERVRDRSYGRSNRRLRDSSRERSYERSRDSSYESLNDRANKYTELDHYSYTERRSKSNQYKKGYHKDRVLRDELNDRRMRQLESAIYQRVIRDIQHRFLSTEDFSRECFKIIIDPDTNYDTWFYVKYVCNVCNEDATFYLDDRTHPDPYKRFIDFKSIRNHIQKHFQYRDFQTNGVFNPIRRFLGKI